MGLGTLRRHYGYDHRQLGVDRELTREELLVQLEAERAKTTELERQLRDHGIHVDVTRTPDVQEAHAVSAEVSSELDARKDELAAEGREFSKDNPVQVEFEKERAREFDPLAEAKPADDRRLETESETAPAKRKRDR